MENDFCRQLNEKLNPDERIFKFKSAELIKNNLTVVLMVRSVDFSTTLTERLKGKVQRFAEEIVPDEFKVNLSFVKAQADERSVVNKVIEYIFVEHKSVYSIFANAQYKLELDGDYGVLNVTIEKYVYDYAQEINMAQALHDFLYNEFFEEIEIVFYETANSESAERKEINIYSKQIRLVDAKPTRVLVKGLMEYPRYICDVSEMTRDESNITVCGVISNVRCKKIIKPDAKIKEKLLFTFLLNDTTGKIKCKFFARPRENFSWEETIVDGLKIILNGSYKYDSFDNKFNIMVNSIAEADIDFDSIDVKSDFNFDQGKYFYVIPEAYNVVAQNDMFDIDMTDLEIFKDTKYVAFDLETTGFDTQGDEIIELAAIKIIDGQFTEKFTTFVHPVSRIPKKITEITGITDDMVAFAPTVEEVIPDFYHFAKDCVLVGHNIAEFDIPFLNYHANKVKYDFNNAFIDTLVLARQKMRLNRNKLSDVCKALKIPLIDAHRAINDVTANAQAFLKLMKM